MRWDFFWDFLREFFLVAFVVVFEVMLSCPLWDSRSAGRGRVCGEVGDRSIFVSRLAPADFRSVAYLVPPYRAVGVRRHSARCRVALGRIGGRLAESTGKV